MVQKLIGGACEPSSRLSVEPSLEAKVFQNPLLLSKIMEHSRSRHVREFRRVNSLWLNICNRNLVLYGDLKIEFVLSGDFRQYFKGSWAEQHHLRDGDKSLKNLMILLDKNSNLWPSPKSTYSLKENFPCTSFTFWSFSLREVHDVQEFFSKFGFLVRNLKIDMQVTCDHPQDPICKTKKRVFETLFRIKLPRLEELTVGNLPKCWDKETKIFSKFPPLQLETVKRFQCTDYDELIRTNGFQEFFQAFPNLKEFGSERIYFQIRLLNVFISLNKFNVIKDLEFSPKGDIQLYEQFSNLPGISLERIRLNLENRAADPISSLDLRRCSQVLSKILQSNRETLKSIDIDLSIGRLTSVEWPVLPHITTVLMSHGSTRQYYGLQSLPINLVFEKVFPNLNHLILETTSFTSLPSGIDSLHPFGPNFTESQAFSQSLGRLTINSVYCNPEWMKMFQKIFPNVHHLKVEVDLNDILRSIWKWSTIEILELEILIGGDYPKNKVPFLDSRFTGISIAECQRILNTPVKDRYSMELKSGRKSSITQMKVLRQLSIYYDVWDWNPKIAEQFHLMVSSSITGNLALNKMPNLMQVNLASSLKKEFKVDDRTVSQIESRIRSEWTPFQFRVLVDLDLEEGKIF